MQRDQRDRLVFFGAAIALFVWFVYVTRAGFVCWFDGDDLMNLHYCWSRPWSALLKANLAFWSSYYRPAGELFYRTIYSIWGFHPLPFRIAAMVLLWVDFALLGVVVWQLTRSSWGVLVSLFLFWGNPAFAGAYFDGGNIYDILAYTFFWGAFALYVHVRRDGRPLGWGILALVFCLFVAALDAKEISISLPAAVGLYELVWHPPVDWKFGTLGRWLWREGRFAILGGLACIAYIAGKRYGPDSLWLVSSYQPHYSAVAYFHSLAFYLGRLIYKPVVVSSWQVTGLLAAMLVVGAATGRRALLWGAGFIAVGVLPLSFIPGRSGTAYVVPSVGWAVCIAELLSWLVAICTGRRDQLRRVVQAVLLLVLILKLAPWQRRWNGMHGHAAIEMQGRFRHYIEQIHALIPAPRKGQRILLLSDADGHDDWDVFFLIRLYYGDPRLAVDRMSVWRERHEHVDLASYDYVLDWVDGQFVLVRP